MPKIAISKAHSLSLEEAKTRVQALVEQVRAQFPSLISGVTWTSDGSSAKVDGSMFDGTFNVDAREIAVRLNLSILASPFRSKVEGQINKALEEKFGTA